MAAAYTNPSPNHGERPIGLAPAVHSRNND